MRRFAGFLAVLAFVLPLHAQQQQPTFEEKIDVSAVLLDVIVTDAKGNQILGLGKDDFVVREGDVEQPVDSVDYFTNRRLLNAREENAPFQVERTREERYFVLFFDKPSDPGALFDQLTRAREAARKFVREEMTPTDQVAVVGHDTRLKVYSDFTADKARLDAAISDASKFGNGISRPASSEGPSILRNIDSGAMMSQTGTVYEALDVLSDSLRSIRARKNLILFSPGIMESGETVREGMIVSRSQHLDPMLQSLNAANVTVYPIQLQRDVDTTPLFHQRLEEIADSTGGHYFQFNTSFAPALQRIENVNNGYYLLTFRSRHRAGEKGFQKVTVSVRNHPEMHVESRSGYQYGG